MTDRDPYDELPYRSVPVIWSAPERLALASLLHGGPRAPLHSYRVLELGCGNGANVLPLAYYRPHASIVGLDGARSAVATAQERRAELGLSNLELVHSDFRDAAEHLTGPFDFILAHGVFSWVSDAERDALLALCARHLAPRGLLYLNYNARPGWNVRGMVRDFLRAQTAGVTDLRARAAAAQGLAATVGASFAAATEHPYSQLMAREFQLVSRGEISYVAHEYLADDNHAYWRSELLAMMRRHGFEHVADADFNHDSGRIPADLTERIAAVPGFVPPIEDAVDLLCYRQLHSPILTRGPLDRRAPGMHELAGLLVASSLVPLAVHVGPGRRFRHPSGLEVSAKTDEMATALARLQARWPRGERVDALFPEPAAVVQDLRLLHLYGLVDLRLVEADEAGPPPGPLNAAERRWGAVELTTPHHAREPA